MSRLVLAILIITFSADCAHAANEPSPHSSASDVLDSNHPTSPRTFSPVCTSFDPRNDTFGMVGPRSYAELTTTCPVGQAMFALRNGTGKRRPGSKFEVFGSCCPLPEGVLTDHHVLALVKCPTGHVVTGSVQVPEPSEVLGAAVFSDRDGLWRRVRTHKLRCTQIDQNRFILLAPQPGWNVGWYSSFTTVLDRRTTRARIPPALRYGLGRMNRTGYSHHFCIGQPWGSLLVGRTTKYCEDVLFSELRYRPRRDTDGPQPVFNFGSCYAVDDPLSSNARCVPELTER